MLLRNIKQTNPLLDTLLLLLFHPVPVFCKIWFACCGFPYLLSYSKSTLSHSRSRTHRGPPWMLPGSSVSNGHKRRLRHWKSQKDRAVQLLKTQLPQAFLDFPSVPEDSPSSSRLPLPPPPAGVFPYFLDDSLSSWKWLVFWVFIWIWSV